jgi:hypothetical protein
MIEVEVDELDAAGYALKRATNAIVSGSAALVVLAAEPIDCSLHGLHRKTSAARNSRVSDENGAWIFVQWMLSLGNQKQQLP